MAIAAGFLLIGVALVAIVVTGAGVAGAASSTQQAVASSPAASPSSSGVAGAVKAAAGVITTKGSWFNDPNTASGIAQKPAISLSDPGVAGGLNLGGGIGRRTLKGWFLVRDPGSRLHIFQQIDLGPAGFTNRGIDYTQEALSHIAGGDPTDKSSQLIYLGMSQAEVAANLPAALAKFGVNATDAAHLAATAFSQGWADL